MKSKAFTCNQKHPRELPRDDRLTSVCRGNISLLVPVVTLGLRRRLISRRQYPRAFMSKTAPDEVGHLDEECAAVAAEAGFELVGERAVSVASQVVVVAGVERRARIRRPSEQELPTDVRPQRGVINSPPREEEPGELIARPPRIDVVERQWA